tara:strand:+ start:27 stop:311 length:285 start_codon:yes stop_codon:yes gene_type:complete
MKGKTMTKTMEPGKLTVKEAFLTRYLSNDDADIQGVALAFVLTLRSDATAREKSDVAHREAFEQWQWDVDQDDVVAILQEHGWANVEEEEAKKD